MYALYAYGSARCYKEMDIITARITKEINILHFVLIFFPWFHVERNCASSVSDIILSNICSWKIIMSF